MSPTDGPAVSKHVPVPGAGRLSALLSRLGVTGVLARDGLLAVAVLLVTGAFLIGLFVVADREGLMLGPVRGPVLAGALCAQVLPLVVRRVRPVLGLGLVTACQVVAVLAAPPELSVGGLPQVIAAYTVGTRLPARRALPVAATAATLPALAGLVTALAADAAPLPLAGSSLLSGLAVSVGSCLVGGAVATRRSYLDLLRTRAAELERTQEATTRAAIVAERSRMARELHDVAAHHLSGLVVQAAAVERQIDSDPATAKAGTAWIRAQGKETLESLRLVVGVLRERPDGEAPGDAHDAPPPGLGALEGLVRTARALGDAVDLVQEGAPRALAPIADAAFYRVVQESLSNARQHAPGAPVRVAVRYGEREVSLAVRNGPPAGSRGVRDAGAGGPGVRPPAARPGPAGRQGLGLIGMRERAQLVGATFAAGPTSDGGWRVLLALPAHHDPAGVRPAGATRTAAPGGAHGEEQG
ncbi:MAG TPA: histidine kinase [Promicromonospora sp.]|nr:histidine kinase [Promicromonospora sp.]